jgi:hypothetical protein
MEAHSSGTGHFLKIIYRWAKKLPSTAMKRVSMKTLPEHAFPFCGVERV